MPDFNDKIGYISPSGNPRYISDDIPLISCAAEWDRPALVMALLDHGAYVDRRDRRGRTALFFAVEGGSLAAARTLLESGSDVSAVDNKGLTPVAVARDAEAVKLLLEFGVSIDQINWDETDIPSYSYSV
ncbi:Ankyrin repeat protein [Aspergillus sclerotialis]|uniref:Ankyrin repeat protein n=1 Tax=Aspergillus sclerotialis TaxID=2070753 RepID=A0A3A2ZDL3_9EURO|nr:Ankyrin repeat protein [Aspergillus sclerotialis]